METFVFLAVLFAAACHAGWNALIKVGLDPLSTTTLISVGSGIVALAFAPLVGMPASAAWPWLLASVIIHLLYFAALIESYRTGDLGQVYPIARGSAPLMTATVTSIFVGEKGKIDSLQAQLKTDYVFLVWTDNLRKITRTGQGGSSVTYTRNPNYWEKDPIGPGKGNQLPYLDGIRDLVIPDLSTRISALRTGKIDAMASVTAEDTQTLVTGSAAVPGLKSLEKTSIDGRGYPMWLRVITRPNGSCTRAGPGVMKSAGRATMPVKNGMNIHTRFR